MEAHMQGNEMRSQPRLSRKLTLNKETVRVLTDKELAGVEGGFRPTIGCSGANTCACGGSCGNNLSTCIP
jgi:bacteriocin-like protein